MASIGKRVTKIEKLVGTSKDKHKGDELQVADRFIEYHNNTYGTDYMLSDEQPLSTNDPVDVYINSESDHGNIVKIQVKTFDPEFRGTINKSTEKEFLRKVNPNKPHPLITEFKKSIPELEIKYKCIDKELVILFDGFWGFNLNEKIMGDLRNLFANKKFKEVWVVNSASQTCRV